LHKSTDAADLFGLARDEARRYPLPVRSTPSPSPRMPSQRQILGFLKQGDADAFAAAMVAEGRDALAAATFEKLTLSYAALENLDLSNTEWEECMVEGASFRGSDLTGAYFNGCTFRDCVFEDVDASTASMDGTIFRGCIFRRANLDSTECTGLEFTSCVLEGVTLDECEWNAVTFSGGAWESVSASSGSLSAVTLRDVTLGNDIDLTDADLSRCMTTGDGPDGFEKLSGKRKRIL
jgi:uncharacterized protein YjbI with pentapeptide repeats